MADRGVAFRTILKRIADHLHQDEINSIAYIRGLPPIDSGRERKALDVLMLLERRGVFSPDDVASLRELLASANRHDLLHSCGIDEYEEKYCKKLPPGEEETEREPIPLVTKDEELQTNGQLATNISGGSIAQDSSQPTDVLEDSPEVADPPASLLPSLSSMTEQDRKTLLQSILDDKDMREQLTSLSSGMFPVTTTQSVAVGGDESLQSVCQLHEIRDDHCLPPRSLSAGDLPSQLQTVNTGSLTTSTTGTQTHASAPNSTQTQVPDPNPTGGGNNNQGSGSCPRAPNQGSGSCPRAPSQGFGSCLRASCRGPKQGTSRRNEPPSVRKDRMTWKLNRKEICAFADKQSNRVFSKEFRLQVDGCRSKPVKLILKLHVSGLGHDKGNTVSLGVLVKVEERCRQLKDTAMLNLLVATRMGKVGQEEFISGKETKKPLDNFVINDFMPHEVLRQCQSNFIEMEAEAFLTFNREDINVVSLEDEEGQVVVQSEVETSNKSPVLIQQNSKLAEGRDSIN